jgi:hypothetical protein
MPLTTPAAKFTAKIFVQNRALLAARSSPVRAAFTVYQATNGAIPIVPMGKR